MRKTAWKTFACGVCGKETVRAGTFSKFCHPCSERRANERKTTYYEKTKVSVEHKARRNQQASKRRREHLPHFPAAGKQRSITRSIMEPFTAPSLIWCCRMSFPFTTASSKNHIYGIAGWHVYKREEVRAFQEEIAQTVREQLKSSKFKPVQNKVWIAIHVEKPNNRFDAINVIDVVADGLKVGLGVDDRWFCIRQVDWSINKNNPRIIVEFGQTSPENVQLCSICGQIQALAEYGKATKQPLGVHRICRSCSSLATELKVKQRASDGVPR